MRTFFTAVGGVLYGVLLSVFSVIGLGGGGDGFLALPGSLLGSPLVFLPAFGYLIAPLLWGVVAALAASGRRDWAILLTVLNYAGLPFAFPYTRWTSPREWQMLQDYREDATVGLAQLAGVFALGQLWIWWLLLKGRPRNQGATTEDRLGRRTTRCS